MASSEGGMEIEEVAAKTPEKILKASTVDPAVGLQPYQARKLAFGIGIPRSRSNKAVKFMIGAVQGSTSRSDGSIAEINPLMVLTKQGDVLALDAKMGFDANALYRHPKDMGSSCAILNEEDDEVEVEAIEVRPFSYIALDGNIGCMVNGAGLAMATMDIIKHFGGEPSQLSRRRRRRHHREGDRGLQDHPLRAPT